MDMPDNWIEIARTGTFTDSAGRPQTFTDSDLAAIAEAYDPAKRDCPLVFGHPRTDAAPAFGWARKLKAEGGRLLAQFDQVPEAVKKIVAAGHYRHVSMSLMPDRKTLRHVALLGAAQPAIDGLKAIELAAAVAPEGLTDGDRNPLKYVDVAPSRSNEITINFAVKDDGSLAEEQAGTCSRRSDPECRTGRATEGYAKMDFSNHAGGNMPESEAQREIGALKERIAALEKENSSLKEQAKGHKEGREKAEAEKKAAEEKEAKTASDFAAYRGAIEKEKREARVAALVESGRVKPAEKADILSFAMALAGQDSTAGNTGVVDFSAPDGKIEKITLEERYFRELESRNPDCRIFDFSATSAFPTTPKHAADANLYPSFDASELTSKL